MDTIKRVTRWFRSSNKKSHHNTAHNTNCSVSSSSRSTQQRCAIDREYNAVVVPAYGGDCLSVSDSDGSDWSIGWTEPHGSGFEAEQGIRDRKDSSFAVLVRCYKSGNVQQRGNSLFRPLSSAANDNARTVSDGESYMHEWLASLPNPDNHDNQIQHQNITSLS